MEQQEFDECNIFVKYLPSDLNDFGLRDLFSPYGQIVSAKVMIDQKKGTSLGYGFVRFEKPEEAKKAAEEMSGKKIGKKKLLCKLSNLPNLTPSNLRPDSNLYVKPLLETTTEDELKSIFSPFGEILECTILYDKDTGKSRQIGFVRFRDLDDATEAMNKMNGFKINSDAQPLVVRYAETENEKYLRKIKTSSLNSSSGSNGGSNNFNLSLNLSNLPNAANSPPSPTFYLPQHIALVPVQMQEGIAYTMPPMGYMPPFIPPGGMHIPIPHNHLSPRSHSPHSPHFTHVQPIIPPLVNLPQLSSFSPRFSSPTTSGDPNLFVFHLPPDVDDAGLKTLFDPFGALESAKVMVDQQTGDSKGYGFVRYKYNDDADRAIAAMNGYQLGNKFLKVSFKTSSPRGVHSPRSYS